MKWPRQWAAEILQLRTREERATALAQVPEEFREWVARLVWIAFERRKYKR